MWIFHRNMYKNVTVKVQWDNTLSEQFTQRQGVRHWGSKLSTILYKRYNNNILDALNRANIVAKLGNISVVTSTCADDIVLLASHKHEIQALLDIVHDSTKKDLVTINQSKSDLVPVTTKCEKYSLLIFEMIL